MNLNDYTFTIIKDTYDIYELDPRVRQILAETWGVKLRGYKNYFSYGIVPVDAYDFICNHIIVCRKGPNPVPLAGIKNITVAQALKHKKEFPIVRQAFGGTEHLYENHIKAVNQWVASHPPEQTAYSFGFTVEPTLPKEEKKFLTLMIFSTFYYFYHSEGIPNIIHAVNVRNRVDAPSLEVGFVPLEYQGDALSLFKVKGLDDIDTQLLVLENYQVSPFYVRKVEQFQDAWEKRNRLDLVSLGLTAGAGMGTKKSAA